MLNKIGFLRSSLALVVSCSYLVFGTAIARGCSLASNEERFKQLTVKDVINTLEKDYKAEDFEESDSVSNCYITDTDDQELLSKFVGPVYSGKNGGSYSMSIDFSKIKSHLQTDDNDFVMYRDGDDDACVIMIFVEFEDSDDAKACFEDIMSRYFFNGDIEQYKSQLSAREWTKEMYSGTLIEEAVSKEPGDEKIVTLANLEETDDGYKKSSDSMQFIYSYHWDILSIGDPAFMQPDDPDAFAKYTTQKCGGRMHNLYVQDNKLIWIDGYDLTEETEKIDLVSKLCNSFCVDDPADYKTDYSLKKYLIYQVRIWLPANNQINSI